MDWKNLLAAALTLVLSYLLRWFFALIQVTIDDATFNAIVAGIVTVLLALFGVDAARALKVPGIR